MCFLQNFTKNLALFSGIAPRIHPIGRIAMKYVKEVLTQNFEYKVSCEVGLSARLRAILYGRWSSHHLAISIAHVA